MSNPSLKAEAVTPSSTVSVKEILRGLRLPIAILGALLIFGLIEPRILSQASRGVVPENYSLANFRAWTDRSRANLDVDTLDLVQLHCPPTAVIESDSVFDYLDTLVAEGAIARYGVSVETADQGLAAIARPGVASVQIILNAFRLKPLDAVLPAALEAGVAVIPLSPFYREPPPEMRIVRLCVAKQDATLIKAAERICAYTRQLAGDRRVER